jgi:hypothetical protein
MDEIISYKMCAVKVRNAKLRNYLKWLNEGLRVWICLKYARVNNAAREVIRRWDV